MRRSLIFFMLGIALFYIIGCESDNNNPIASNEDLVDSITWVGTDLIYGDSDSKKPYSAVLIYVDWCGWCKKMKNETLADSTVINTLNNYFNAIKVNPEIDSSVVFEDSSLTCYQFVRENFTISGYPTVIILNSSDQEVAIIRGYISADKFMEYLRYVILSGL